MASFVKMLSFTQFVDKQNLALAADPFNGGFFSGLDPAFKLVRKDDCIEKFAKCCDIQLNEAFVIFESALGHGYVRQHHLSHSIGDSLSVDPAKGRDFLQSIAGFPIGMCNEVLSIYKPFVALISGGLFGAGVTVILRWTFKYI